MSEMLMRVYQFMSQSGVCLKRNSSILAHEAGAGEEAVMFLSSVAAFTRAGLLE